MSYDSFRPLEAPATGVLRVLGIARISTKNQDEMSLEDQGDLHQEFVREHYAGPLTYQAVATQAKGEWLDRDELHQIRTAIQTNQYDLLVMEDLGRLLRGVEAVNFCKMAVDQDVRLIAINDGVDTASEDWEEKASNASIRHARYVEETSRRIKQRKRARFIREGRALACEIYGYIKKPGAQTEDDLERDRSAEPIYDNMFTMLENEASYAEVGDWLNDAKVKVGPYCRTSRWTGPMVSRVVHNPLLKGLRVRNRRVTRKHHGSGKRKSVKARPEELRTRHCPHLAFIAPDRYDRVLRLLDLRNKNLGRKPVHGQDPLLHRPRKRTVWPGQHLYCAVCGRMYIYGGHGRTGYLTCSGIESYHCWNTFSVGGQEAGRRLFAAVLRAIEDLPHFDEAFRQFVAEQLQAADAGQLERVRDLERQQAVIQRQQQNLIQQIRESGPSRLLGEEITRMEQAYADLGFQIQRAKAARPAAFALPPAETLRAMALEAVGELAPDSPEFLRHMQQLIPRIWLYPFRLLDGGHIVLRAQFVLNLASLVQGASQCPEAAQRLSHILTVKLYEDPDREQHRLRAVAAMARCGNQHAVAAELGIPQAVVSKALRLQEKMDALGVTDAYALVPAPPSDYTKIRLHRHRRYCFAPDSSGPLPPPYWAD